MELHIVFGNEDLVYTVPIDIRERRRRTQSVGDACGAARPSWEARARAIVRSQCGCIRMGRDRIDRDDFLSGMTAREFAGGWEGPF